MLDNKFLLLDLFAMEHVHDHLPHPHVVSQTAETTVEDVSTKSKKVSKVQASHILNSVILFTVLSLRRECVFLIKYLLRGVILQNFGLNKLFVFLQKKLHNNCLISVKLVSSRKWALIEESYIQKTKYYMTYI